MKCPFCTHEIDAQAVVCPNCRQFLVGPLVRRIEALERTLREAQEESEQKWDTGPFPAILAAFFGVTATAGFFFVHLTASGLGPAFADWAILGAIAMPPAILGLLLGYSWHGGRGRAYLLCGFGMGLVNLLAVWTLLYNPDRPFNWPWAVVVFVIGQPLVFFFGGLLGRALTPRSVERRQWSLERVLDRWFKHSERLKTLFAIVVQLLMIMVHGATVAKLFWK